jgi:hypothetical protein
VTRLWPEGEAVESWGGGETPSGFTWQGTAHQIQEVCNRWRLHTRWWDARPGTAPADTLGPGTWREYVKVATDRGLLCLLYQDLHSGQWYLARVYD